MNCLNGYFVAPNYESLSEALVKADGQGSDRGVLALGPVARRRRRTSSTARSMAELTSGTHERLGDAILAAQRAYARAGVMPELLSVYHLIGDPATKIR